jgi:hypothetical protein
MDYQPINMAALGLPQRRLIPAMEDEVAVNDGLLSQVYMKLLRQPVKVETGFHLNTEVDPNYVRCPAIIKDWGTVLITISIDDLECLTSYYLNELPHKSQYLSAPNKTMHRLLEKMVLENIRVTFPGSDYVINPSSPLPSFALQGTQVIMIEDKVIKLHTWLCMDAFDSLCRNYLGKNKLEQDDINHFLEDVPILGRVELLSKKMNLEELNAIQVGDVMLMEKLVPALRFSEEYALSGEIVTTDSQLSLKIQDIKN